MTSLTPSPLPILYVSQRETLEPACAVRSVARQGRQRSTEMREEAMSMHMPITRRGEVEGLQFRLLYAICFCLFLIAAAIQRVLPWRWLGRAGATAHHSVFTQARNAAGICATYVFMV